MDIVVTTQNDVVIVEPRGRLDSTTSRAFADRLLEQIKAGTSRVLVDLNHVIYISSAGFRVLLIAGQRAMEAKCALALCNLNQEVRRLFEIGAFLDDFEIYASREAGLVGGR